LAIVSIYTRRGFGGAHGGQGLAGPLNGGHISVSATTVNVTGLIKYVEWMSRGRRTGRIAYVMKEWNLPLPLLGSGMATRRKV
jgi:hypothetical protein